MSPQPFVVAPQSYPAPLDVRGEEIRVLASGEATGSYEIFHQTGPDGSGPPPHAHPWDESFYVVSGVLDFGIGDQKLEAGPGTLVHLPAGTTHWFRFRAGGGEMISMTNRRAASDMFTDIHHAKALSDTDPAAFAEVAKKHGLTRPVG
jgi:quercetin dioxygenase-like cupin family protein